jgi:hypothetical protein
MRRIAVLLIAIILMHIPSSGPPAEAQQPKKTLVLHLKAVKETIAAGTAPTLRLTIENVGDVPQKILKPRGDLQDTYYELEVSKGKIPMLLRRAIADPGPVGAEDYLTLAPGKSASFEFTRYVQNVNALTPGQYSARIRFWQDPLQPRTTAISSPSATFNVE